MANKIKTYVIMVSRTFPAYHPKKGQPTFFEDKILRALNLSPFPDHVAIDIDPKVHTFRGNLPLWQKRIKEVQEGRAILSLRYWSGSPYNYQRDGSKPIEFAQLDKESGVGVQEAIYQSEFEHPYDGVAIKCEGGIFRDFPFYLTAENDGLSQRDFTDWFEKGKYDLKEPMACIHFTSFRYGRTTLPTPK